MQARIFHSLEEARGRFGPSSLTIGNFDGVHAGHARILRRVCEVARENGWKPSVLTFDPHPTRIVAPSRSPRLMTTPEQRCRLMEQEGIRQVLILPFTREVAQLTPEQFVRDVLVEALGTAGRAVSPRGGAMPVLSGIRALLSGNELQLTGSDTDLTIEVSITVSGDRDGVVVLPAGCWRGLSH